MCAVSAELRTFATELSSLKAEMNNPLQKNTNTRLLLFGELQESRKFKEKFTPKV